MRTIGVITTARSDYGIYLPLLDRIQSDQDLSLQLYVTGMHLLAEYGMTVQQIEQDGYAIAARVEMPMSDDSPRAVAEASGAVTRGFAAAYAQQKPDVLVALGDRFEMHAAVVASLPFGIPVAHLHGGETTQGAVDEVYRHCLTKMAHLHFPSTEVYARRIMQMGEMPGHVHLTGALGLDNLQRVKLLDRDELQGECGLDLADGFLLVTYHPVTRQPQQVDDELHQLMSALAASDRPVVFTYPNADVGNLKIIEAIERYVTDHNNAQVAVNLGTAVYWSVMKHASAMVGNSSSGIIEAASLELPVVNVGHRQAGRIKGKNVIDVGPRADDILAGIHRAVGEPFGRQLRGMTNPYGDGQAAARVLQVLKTVELGPSLVSKPFCDLNT